MNKIRFLRWISIGLLFLLPACQAAGPLSSGLIVGAGDTVNGLGLTTGVTDTPPLYGFCSSSNTDRHTKTLNCRVSVMPAVAIGHIALFADEALATPACSARVWKLLIDDRAIDLDSFGMVEYDLPTTGTHSSSGGEVLERLTAWDVVLTNLSPGEHTLRYVVQTGTDSYTWLVNLMVEPAENMDMSAAPFPLHS